MQQMPEEVRLQNVNTRDAGIRFMGEISVERAAVFWGSHIRCLKGNVKLAYEAWKRDCERIGMYLATRTGLFQGFVGFYGIHGPESAAIVKGLARHRPDVIVMLTSHNNKGHTLPGSVFGRHRN